MRDIIQLNDGWEFTPRYSEAFARGEDSFERVRLPHTCKQTPFHYFSEESYQMVCGYRKRLDLRGKGSRRAFIVFGAAAHYAKVYLDGICIAEHRGGYTAFEAELCTDKLMPLLTVELDTRESLDFPPFGKVIDYMTYGGLYREVRLEYRSKSYLSDVFVKPQVPAGVKISPKMNQKLIGTLTFEGVVECEIEIQGSADAVRLTALQKDGGVLAQREYPVGETYTLRVPKARLWDVESPTLYDIRAELLRGGEVIDDLTRRVGFRRILMVADGFYLNGRKLRLRGLNRHQSYPYVGCAMPRSMQRLDADILRYELGCNAVRTSHYPQSQHFIDRCDEIGLLVFTEIPGWQHIGSDGWKKAALRMTGEMVRQYRNHPSIFLWGVRINESRDDHDFYRRTNRIARDLDPTRPTGGVRCHKKSELLEDVYTYNDFVHDGKAPGCEPKKAITSDMDKAYLISEYGGHTYPCKAFDDEEQRLEQALRHARVMDAAASHDDIAGAFGWCMFDYNTHKEFGAGDRICYHGVTDMFRNKKFAADVYAVQQDETPVLSVSSSMDIGDHPGSNRGRVYILTNADSVRFYKNDSFIREYTHADSEFKYLRRPPIEITDYIGSQVADNEDFSPKQAAFVKDILNESTRFGMNDLPLDAKRKAAHLMLRYRMSFDDAYQLYGKYIGNWGDKSVVYRFEAVKNDRIVKVLNIAPFEERALKVRADHTDLVEDGSYDVAAVRIRMTDQNGNTLPYFHGAVGVRLSGEAELIGEDPVMLRGGMGGVYVRTTGKSGTAELTISAEGAKDKTITFRITTEEVE